jgi:hypothetical protein
MAPAKRRAPPPRRAPQKVTRRGRSHDAVALRTQFLAGNLSTRAFAAHTGVPYPTLRKIAERDKWDAARKAYRAQIAAKSLEANIERRIELEAEIDGLAHEAALKLSRKLHALVDTVKGAASARDVAKALTDLHRLARITAHLSPEPVASPEAPADGELVMRRKGPNGEIVEETVASSSEADTHDRGPHGLPADGHPVAVPPGPHEPGEGDDRRSRLGEDAHGG